MDGERMQCGLFGKLVQRRDFVSVAVPREFLRLWEPWIENGLSQSQRDLDRKAWVDMFTAAPIWRFFLGAGLCGSTICGAFMPSMDGLGRYFPLTLLAWSADGASLTPPDVDPRRAWFDEVEELLLSTLKSELSMEAIVAALPKLAALEDMAKINMENETLFVSAADPAAQAQPLRQIFAAGPDATAIEPAQMTFWWTLGGEADKAWAWSRKSMPNPQQFTAMLAGRVSQLPQDLFPARPLTRGEERQ